MKKRFAISALALCLALILLPARAWAASGTSGDWGVNLHWSYNSSTRTLTITGTGEMPDSDKDGTNLPFDLDQLRPTSVVIGEGVTSIGSMVFYCYGTLDSVTIPSTVTSIGDYAFYQCYGLTGVSFPDGITSIGESAFGGCYHLTDITINAPQSPGGGAGSLSIGPNAFSGCYWLAGVDITGSVGSIGDEAFSGCYHLTDVDITGDVGSIGNKAFSGCSDLARVHITGDVGSIGDKAFLDCHRLASVTVTGDVGSIGARAFADNSSRLTDVAVTGRVGAIESEAFSDCDNLARFSAGSVGSIGDYAFYYCASLAEFSAGSVDSIGTRAFEYCDSLVKFSIPNGAASLGQRAFSSCGKLTTVYIPSSATIGSDPFYRCDELADVYYGGTQAQWETVGKPNVPISNEGLPIIHCGAAGLPPTTVHDADELFRLLEAGKDAALTYIDLDSDIQLDVTTGGLLVSAKHAVQLDLKGHQIISNTVFPMATVRGELTVLDSTVTSAPTVDANGSVGYSAGGFSANSGSDKAVIAVEDGGSFTLREGKIESYGPAISADNDEAQSGVWDTSSVRIDGGYVKADWGSAVSLYRRAGVRIGGGVLVSEGNTVIDVSDRPEARKTYSYVSMWDGVLISKGAPSGSLPCGIYFPQNGSVSIYSGEIRAPGGIGILMRSGSLSISGNGQNPPAITVSKAGTGKLGSSELALESGHCVVMDEKSGYYPKDGSNTSNSFKFELYKSPEEFRPYAYVSEGCKLKTNQSGTSYFFGPSAIYTVTFNANGGGGDDVVLKTNTDQRIEDWPAPTREGYVFRGWGLAEGSLRELKKTYEFGKDTTLYAIWTPEGCYFVDFIIYDEAGISSRHVTGPDGRAGTWPRNPVASDSPWANLDRSVFAGWRTSAYGGTLIERDHVFTEDTTLYVFWEDMPGPYTVTFDLNGGVGSGGTQTTDVSGKLTADQWPEDPTREGYVFKGWTQFENSVFIVSRDDNFYRDTTLYAKWVPADGYVITFNLNEGGGAGTTYATKHTTADGVLSPWPNDPQRDGYRFRGWYFDRTGGYRLDLERSYDFWENTTLYAHWTKSDAEKTYTITFDANGGKGGATLTTGANGRLPALPAANPTRTGYTFSGWYTAATGGSKVTTSTQFKKDATVYAHWAKDGGSDTPDDTKKTYTITFHANGGSVSPSSAATNDGGKVALPTPARPGYTFAGWFTAPSGGTQVGASTVFTANTTLYAHWNQSPSTPSTTYYQIYTPGTTYGGGFYVSHSFAAPGALVTVTSSPWNNFELSRLSAIRVDTGGELYLTGRYGSQYTFLMPDSDVQLIGSYAQTNAGAVNPGYPGTSTGTVSPGSPSAAGARPVNWYYSGGRIYHVTGGLVPVETQLTRDMLVSVLYNMDSSSSGAPTIWAAENSIVPDIYQSGLWGADKSISREQAAMILFCYARHKGYATYQTARLTGYRDYSQLRPIARPAVAWCQATGLIPAASASTLSPQAILTCGEANAILARFVSTVARG